MNRIKKQKMGMQQNNHSDKEVSQFEKKKKQIEKEK